MSGIAFMFINVRVGLGWAQKANPDSSGNPGSRIENSRAVGVTSDAFAMRPLAVNITKVVDKDDHYQTSGDNDSFGKSAVA